MASPLSPEHLRSLIPAQALGQVPGYSDSADLAALELHGGTLNRSFRLRTPAGEFVIRLHDPKALALGANHLRETQLQNAAAAVGVAPRVLYVDPQQRFMVSQFVAGRVWEPGDFASAERLAELGHCFARLHAVTPPIEAPFDLARLLEDFAARIGREASGERRAVEQLMRRAGRSLAACASQSRPRRLFHSDPWHSNLIDSASGVMLVDWEYAAIGDPLYDLACVLAYHPQAHVHAAVLLEASGLAQEATLAMLRHAGWLYLLLNYFWYRTRRLDEPVSPEDLAQERALLARLQ